MTVLKCTTGTGTPCFDVGEEVRDYRIQNRAGLAGDRQ